MAIYFGELKLKVLSLLSDELLNEESASGSPIAGTQTSAELLLDAVDAALIACSTRVWKPSVVDTPAGVSAYELPVNFIDMEGVRDKSNSKLIPRIPLKVGQIYEIGWSLYPFKTITFTKPMISGATLYYSSKWNSPSNEDGDIDSFEHEFPYMLIPAVTLYSAHYCMLSRASQSAVIRQYNTKVDSGTPIDNPILDMSKSFHTQFETELKRLPQTEKGVTF